MKKYWIKIRRIGKLNFILLYSLVTGLLMALVTSLIRMIFDANIVFNILVSPVFWGMLVGGIFGGVLISYTVWEIFESSLKKNIEEKKCVK